MPGARPTCHKPSRRTPIACPHQHEAVIWENIYPRGFPFHGAALRLGKAHRMARNATSSTIHDVARAAGVSIATVSKAVNNKGRMRPVTRARVHRIAQELGFRPNDLALSLRRRRSFTVLGVYYPDVRDAQAGLF